MGFIKEKRAPFRKESPLPTFINVVEPCFMFVRLPGIGPAVSSVPGSLVLCCLSPDFGGLRRVIQHVSWDGQPGNRVEQDPPKPACPWGSRALFEGWSGLRHLTPPDALMTEPGTIPLAVPSSCSFGNEQG